MKQSQRSAIVSELAAAGLITSNVAFSSSRGGAGSKKAGSAKGKISS